MDYAVEIKFQELKKKLEPDFGPDLDVQAILYLIGVQELGQGYVEFTKRQKLELMHIAICTILVPYGYYKFERVDEDGWPHFSEVEKLPVLDDKQQQHLMKEALIEYFNTVIEL
jgi:hypothetical protein